MKRLIMRKLFLSTLLFLLISFLIVGCASNGEEAARATTDEIPDETAGPEIETLARQGPPDRLPVNLKFASVSFHESEDDSIVNEQESLKSDQNQEVDSTEEAAEVQAPKQTSQTEEVTSPEPDPETSKPEETPDSTKPSEEPKEPEEFEPPRPGTMEYIIWQQGKGQRKSTQTTTETKTIVIQDPESGMVYHQETTTQTVD